MIHAIWSEEQNGHSLFLKEWEIWTWNIHCFVLPGWTFAEAGARPTAGLSFFAHLIAYVAVVWGFSLIHNGIMSTKLWPVLRRLLRKQIFTVHPEIKLFYYLLKKIYENFTSKQSSQGNDYLSSEKPINFSPLTEAKGAGDSMSHSSFPFVRLLMVNTFLDMLSYINIFNMRFHLSKTKSSNKNYVLSIVITFFLQCTTGKK